MKIGFREYMVITPCRNEEKNLPNLYQSMLLQTMKPSLWVIVDDGSTDKTAEIIEQFEEKHSWIKGIFLEKCNEYMGSHISYVYNEGFKFAKKYSNENNLPYQYIAVVDSDNIPEVEYFEKLFCEFEKDPKLGIASGIGLSTNIEKTLQDLRKEIGSVNVMDPEFWRFVENSNSIDENEVDLPIGSARVWRKECFEETKGYADVKAPDSVSNIKAKIRGWKTKRFNNIRVIEREGLIAQGFWKGYSDQGDSAYFLFYPMLLAILKTLKYSFKRPYYSGIAYLWGYTKSFIYRKKRIDDSEIRQYYNFIQPQDIKIRYKKRIKQILKIN